MIPMDLLYSPYNLNSKFKLICRNSDVERISDISSVFNKKNKLFWIIAISKENRFLSSAALWKYRINWCLSLVSFSLEHYEKIPRAEWDPTVSLGIVPTTVRNAVLHIWILIRKKYKMKPYFNGRMTNPAAKSVFMTLDSRGELIKVTKL